MTSCLWLLVGSAAPPTVTAPSTSSTRTGSKWPKWKRAAVARAVFSTGLVLLILECLNVSIAQAQRVDPELWIPNGPVYSVAKDGNTLFIGGSFSNVGPYTGAGVPLDRFSGVPLTGFPKVRGLVSAVAADGQGGWFIGGTFDSVASLPRRNLVHVRSDLTVDTWNPGADGNVAALVLNGASLYVGGHFSRIGGQTRNRVAALDAVSGAVTPWNPSVNAGFPSEIYALAVSGTTVYAGGFFNTIGGQPRSNIAALDAATGLAKPWTPNAYSSVLALAVSGNTIYAGGTFGAIGGQPRHGIAALDATSGAATLWNPNANGDAYDQVHTLAVSGATIYAGGSFNSMGGQPRKNIAALDATTGAATAWDPSASGIILSLAVSGTTVYAGGTFDGIGGQPRKNIAALDASTGAAMAWSPDVDGDVAALLVTGTTVCAGGAFRNVAGEPRNKIAAIDAATGALTGWNPNVEGSVVWTLACSGATVYAGGDFTDVGGVPAHFITAIDDPSIGIVITAMASYFGSIAPSGSVVVPEGGSQTFTIAPDAWCRVLDVWVDGVSVGAVTSYTFTNVQASHTITAVFAYVAVGDARPAELSLALLGQNPETGPVRFRLGLPEATPVRLSIYDIEGRRLTTLVDGELSAGYHTFALERGDAGHGPGVYFALMTVNGRQFAQRFVVLR